jgi:hypothetical protein
MRSKMKRLKRDTEAGRVAVASSGTVAVAQESGSQVAAARPAPASGSSSSPALAPSTSWSAVKVAEVPVAVGRKLWKILVPAAVVVVAAALIGGGLYPRSHPATPLTKAPPLTERDTVVLADFKNNTGDGVFDDTLKQALVQNLSQCRYNKVTQK